MPTPPSSHSDYTVGWISATQTEYVVACELLDEEYDPLPLNVENDNNVYTFGRIGGHYVVLACLPIGKYGLTSATSVAKDMLRSFPSVRFGLMVGIGGGAPSYRHDIRLGDVVVSTPVGTSSGVIHYESGKAIQNRDFVRMGSLSATPPLLLAAIHQLSSLHERRGHHIVGTIDDLVNGNSRLQKYRRPAVETDMLYNASFIHPDPSRSCMIVCNEDPAETVVRTVRGPEHDDPVIHYGLIASADHLMKDARVRDTLAETEDVLCFEMEAAGLMDNFPCAVIRGICDYADTHKNDTWQAYAAATAAAYAKELLITIPAGQQMDASIRQSARAATLSKALFTVPFGRDPLFVSRDSIFDQVQKRLGETQQAVLYGLGGTGKSQIAIEFAHQYRQNHPETHVLWVYAATSSRFTESCQKIASRLRLPGSDDPTKDMSSLLARWLEDEGNGSWLLIIDGADDSDVILGRGVVGQPPVKAVVDFLPRLLCSSHHLLFTTRSRDIADSLIAAGSPIHVGPFSVEEARLLLTRRLENEMTVADDDLVHKLLELLGYVPLAITQAAAFINRNGCHFRHYLDAFEHNTTDRNLQLSIELQDHRRERGMPNSIFRTWKLSFDQIRQQDPEAADLLSLMALLDGQSIPEEVVRRPQINEMGWRNSLGTLFSYSLANSSLNNTLTMHPLVQMSVRYWLDSENRMNEFVDEVIKSLASNFPTGEYENRAICQMLRPHAEIALQYQASYDSFGASLLHKLAWFELDSGYFEQAENHIRRSYDARRQIFGEQSLPTLSSLSLLATILQARGQYVQAQEMQERALDGRRNTLGHEHPDTIRTINNLATILRDQGKYDVAELLHRQALDTRQRLFGPNHPSTLTSVNNLALLLRDQGKYEAAEELHRRALEGQKATLGPRHPSTLTKLHNLALVLTDQGKYQSAEKLHRDALKGREEALGPDHPDSLKSLNNLGTVLTSQGKLDEAEEVLRKALRSREKSLGSDHPDTLKSLNNLANVLVSQDMFQEAEKLHKAALEGRERILGLSHPDTLRSVRDMAYIDRTAGRLEEAAGRYKRALDGFRRVLGDSHPATTNCVEQYDRLKGDMEDYDTLETRVEGNKRRKIDKGSEKRTAED